MKWNFWKCGFLRNDISQLMTHHLQINIDIITHDSAPPRHSLWYQCWFARDSSFVVKYHFSKTTFSEIVHLCRQVCVVSRYFAYHTSSREMVCNRVQWTFSSYKIKKRLNQQNKDIFSFHLQDQHRYCIPTFPFHDRPVCYIHIQEVASSLSLSL